MLLKIKKTFSVFICLIIVLSMCSCKKNDSSNQTIFYNLNSNPATLDPQIADDESSKIIIDNIFEGLVCINENNEIVPGVANSWESNDDYTSFTFSLRKDATWSNEESTPVTAKDFLFALTRAVSPSTKSKTANVLYPIKNAKSIINGSAPVSSLGVYVIDDYTIKFDLEYSYKDFPRLMSLPVALPCNEAFFNTTDGQYGLKSNTIISNGPFIIKARYGWDYNNAIHLIKNENYKGNNKAVCAGVSFSIGKNIQDVVSAINSGTIDAGELPSEQLNAAQKSNFNITSFEDTTWGICFNFDDEYFSNENIRKSFIQSLSRDYILSSIPKNCSVANNIVPNDITVNGKPYNDLIGSSKILTQLEKPDDLLYSGLKELGKTSPPNVTIIYPDDAKIKPLVNNILELWNQNLGSYFNIKALPKDEFDTKIFIGDYQIALTSIVSTSNNPTELFSKFKSDSKYNFINMKSSQFDSIVNSFENNQDLESALINAETYLNNHAAFYPIYFESKYYASASNVSSIIFKPYHTGINFIKAVKNKSN